MIYNRDCSSVCTVSEVMRDWRKSRKQVIRAIRQGKLAYRKTFEGIYIISFSSVIALWGQKDF